MIWLFRNICCWLGVHSPVYRHPKTGIYLHSYVWNNIGVKCDYCDLSLTKSTDPMPRLEDTAKEIAEALDHQASEFRAEITKLINLLHQDIPSTKAHAYRLEEALRRESKSKMEMAEGGKKMFEEIKKLETQLSTYRIKLGPVVEALEIMFRLYDTYGFNHHSYCADYGKNSLLSNSHNCICQERKDFKNWGEKAKKALSLLHSMMGEK